VLLAGHGSRAVHCLRSLGSRYRGFECHSGHGCLVLVYVCAFFCVCVQVEALRWADHPSKESYRLSLIKKLRKLSPMLQKREQALKCGSKEEEKRIVLLSVLLWKLVADLLLISDLRSLRSSRNTIMFIRSKRARSAEHVECNGSWEMRKKNLVAKFLRKLPL
jgi:hypothetical protein